MSGPSDDLAPPPPAEPRQRWRLVLARGSDAPVISPRDVADTWLAAIEASGLPLHRPGSSGRPKIALGAPLGLGMTADGELLDLVLTEMWPVWQVRAALADRLPAGWRLVDVYDIWLGAPPLPGQVAAADYRIELAGPVDAAGLATAAAALLAAEQLPRDRVKGGGTVRYDLRPLLIDLRVERDGGRCTVVARTRLDPARGTGRPDEVVAALGDAVGSALTVGPIRRERLLLVDELDDPASGRATGPARLTEPPVRP